MAAGEARIHERLLKPYKVAVRAANVCCGSMLSKKALVQSLYRSL
jgi:hypothetical protein